MQPTWGCFSQAVLWRSLKQNSVSEAWLISFSFQWYSIASWCDGNDRLWHWGENGSGFFCWLLAHRLLEGRCWCSKELFGFTEQTLLEFVGNCCFWGEWEEERGGDAWALCINAAGLRGAVSVALINQPSLVSWVREGIKASERQMHHLSESEGDKSGDKTLAHRMCGKRHVAKSFLASNHALVCLVYVNPKSG